MAVSRGDLISAASQQQITASHVASYWRDYVRTSPTMIADAMRQAGCSAAECEDARRELAKAMATARDAYTESVSALHALIATLEQVGETTRAAQRRAEARTGGFKVN